MALIEGRIVEKRERNYFFCVLQEVSFRTITHCAKIEKEDIGMKFKECIKEVEYIGH